MYRGPFLVFVAVRTSAAGLGSNMRTHTYIHTCTWAQRDHIVVLAAPSNHPEKKIRNGEAGLYGVTTSAYEYFTRFSEKTETRIHVCIRGFDD